MKLAEAMKAVRELFKENGYDGVLTEKATKECAEVYIAYLDEEDDTPGVRFGRAPRGNKSNLDICQWVLVRTRSFYRWFGKSVITDENEEPRIMWHGPSKPFKAFKPESIKVEKSRMTLWSGPGFYFTPSKKVADIYAKGEAEPMAVFLRMENPLVVDETGNAETNADRITRRQAELIFADGDNDQWLDHGLANELSRMDRLAEMEARVTGGEKDGKRKTKRDYKLMTRAQRIALFVARLKTDVVKLKMVTAAFGAKSQRKMLASICKHTGHDGIIHTLAPEVVEYVVYDPKAIKSATGNCGDFSKSKESVMDTGDVMKSDDMSGMAKVVTALTELSKRSTFAQDDGKKSGGNPDSTGTNGDEGRWITTHDTHRHVHINAEGVPDKGNEHIIAAMEGNGGEGGANSESDNPPSKSDTSSSRITPEEDAAYADAVKRGDKETALRMIREAAAKAMPNTKVVGEDGLPMVLYHETDNDFTVFDVNRSQAGAYDHDTPFGIFMKPYKNLIGVARKSPKQMALFANIKKSIEFGDRRALHEYLVEHVKGYVSAMTESRDVFRKYENSWKDAMARIDKGEEAFEDVDEINKMRITETNVIYAKAKKLVNEHFRSIGIDGLRLKKDRGMFSTIETYIALRPSQVKSADITYDDAGKLIPLSERFNSKSDDIRYSIPEIYTGSAADYDRPSLHHVGTGEGSQVYGWGLYGSSVRGVAEGYLPSVEQQARAKNQLDYLKHRRETETDPHALEHWDFLIGEGEKQQPKRAVYEQTFFTDRAPGDESHLLNWYEPVSEENKKRIYNQAEKEGFLDIPDVDRKSSSIRRLLEGGTSAEFVYRRLERNLGSPQAASEFLARADIDGIKYPVDSYGGKGVKDGDKAGWNYVSFRDDNIRVDRKWVDGKEMPVAGNERQTAAMVSALKDFVPGVKVSEISDDNVANGSNGAGGGKAAIKGRDGKIAGWYDRTTGEVKLVKGRASAATVAHEIGWHAVYHWAEKNHPELHAKLTEYAKAAPEGIEKSVKERYGTNLSPEELLDEVGAERFTREDISPLVDAAMKRAAEGWFDKVEGAQDEVRGKFADAHKGKTTFTKDELDHISRLPPKQAVEHIVRAMLEGRTLSAGKDCGEDGYGNETTCGRNAAIERLVSALNGIGQASDAQGTGK